MVLLGVLHLVSQRLVDDARVEAGVLCLLLCCSSSGVRHSVAGVHFYARYGVELVEGRILRALVDTAQREEGLRRVENGRGLRRDDERQPLILVARVLPVDGGAHVREALAAREAVKEAEAERRRRAQEYVARGQPPAVRRVAWRVRLVGRACCT
jgi:hypothetical protein